MNASCPSAASESTSLHCSRVERYPLARYKHIDTSPRFIAVDLQRQLLPGTFEYALIHLIDHELDLSGFDARFNNDATGATAYPPAMLLKVILFADSQGIVSSRCIERSCRDHVTFIALSGDSQPHFTALAGFVSTLNDDIARVFTQILYLCDRQGLIAIHIHIWGRTRLFSWCRKN